MNSEMNTLRKLLIETKDGEWGKDKPFNDSVEMVVIRGTDFETAKLGNITGIPVRYVSERAASRKTLIPSDILIETAGGSKGKPTGRTLFLRPKLFKNTSLPITCASFARFMRVDAIKADPEFIYWYLQYLYRNGTIENHQIQHTGIARFQFTKFADTTEITLPAISVQKDISSFFGTIDDHITLLRETNTTLESIAQALFKSWFVDFDPVRAKQEGRDPEGIDAETAALFPDSFEESELGLIPKGWRVSRLGDIVCKITKGTTPTTLKRQFVSSGINFIKAESITNDGWFLPEKFAFIDNETNQLLKRSQLEKGDVLVSIAGTIGRIAVISENYLPANTNQAVALIRPIQDQFPSGLVSRFLQRSESKKVMEERVVQAVQANLSLGSLSDMKVVIPSPIETYQLCATGLSQIDNSKINNYQRMQTLAEIRDTLLPRLISGQLRIPEAEEIVEDAIT